MFNYIYNWWWYNPDIEEQKTFEKIEVEKKKDKVLEDIKTFDKNTLKKPLTPLQKMKKCKFRKKRKSKKR